MMENQVGASFQDEEISLEVIDSYLRLDLRLIYLCGKFNQRLEK
jgi:hypothetical protein